jgi:membrane protein YdbS with pleckstrin-like domain
MPFINTAVDLSLLPAAEQVVLKPIHPSYLKLLRIEWSVTSLFLTLVVISLLVFVPSIFKTSWWWIIITAAFAIIIPYGWLQEKSFPFRAYAVREHDVIYQKGWLIRTLKVCPFNRIQNCTISSGPVERSRKLASLILYTAGASGADMRIPGLLQEEAEQLRQFILNKINGAIESH